MANFNFNKDDFIKTKEKAEILYKTIIPVICPYFGEKIVFNVKGLKHLKFKSDQQARSYIDQYPRLKLLYLAPEVLKKSHTVQGIWKVKRFEDQKTNSRWEHIMKDVIYYEFIAVLENIRIKVIVKEVLGGEKHFWSIIPFWGIDKIHHKRILHGGDLEND
jgi:hypothetical protein